MIAVLASRLDPEAQAVVAEWSAAEAALLSAEDLGSAGWAYSPGDPGSGTAVVDGRRIRVADLTAVLTRRPAVLAEELHRIDPTDRVYVAAEMNAFLVAWLSALPCPVVNRATPTSLCGPAWDKWQWQTTCARLGIDWVDHDENGATHEVVVCGERCLFTVDTDEAAKAKRLSQAAATELLGVRFAEGKVCGVTVAPALADAEMRACLLARLKQRP